MQREGRGARHGNEIAKLYADNNVIVSYYATKGSLDAYRFNLVHIKKTFVEQIKNRTIAKRIIDEGASDESTGVNIAEYVALLTGNTDLLEKAKLDQKIAGMQSEKKSFYRQRELSESKLLRFESTIKTNLKRIADIKKDLRHLNTIAPADEKGTRPNGLLLNDLKNQTTEKQTAALLKIAKNEMTDSAYKKIGTLYDFGIVAKTEWGHTYFYVDSGKGIYYTCGDFSLIKKGMEPETYFNNALKKIPKLIDFHEKENAEMERDLPTLREVAAST